MRPQFLRYACCFLLLAGILTACGEASVTPSAALPTNTVTVVPYVALPLPTLAPAPTAPGGCDRNELVLDLQSSLPYPEASLSHNAIYNVHTLNVWFVDPGIDPLASADDVSHYADLARTHAAAVSHALARASGCVASSFDGITVRVVDREYNEWFTGQVAPSLVPESPALSQDELAQLARSFVPGYQRNTDTRLPAALGTTPEGCTWTEAHARLQALFGADQHNATSYVVRDDKGTNVWVQWEGPPVFEVFLSDVTRIAGALPCLASMDTLWLIYVDGQGETQLILAADGEAVRTVDPARLVEYLELIYPAPQ